jgi:hypothetical protein
LRLLKQSRLDNSRDALMAELCTIDLLIIDDFALEPMSRDESRDIYQLFVERTGRAAREHAAVRWYGALRLQRITGSARSGRRTAREQTGRKTSASSRSVPTKNAHRLRIRRASRGVGPFRFEESGAPRIQRTFNQAAWRNC